MEAPGGVAGTVVTKLVHQAGSSEGQMAASEAGAEAKAVWVEQGQKVERAATAAAQTAAAAVQAEWELKEGLA